MIDGAGSSRAKAGFPAAAACRSPLPAEAVPPCARPSRPNAPVLCCRRFPQRCAQRPSGRVSWSVWCSPSMPLSPSVRLHSGFAGPLGMCRRRADGIACMQRHSCCCIMRHAHGLHLNCGLHWLT